MKKWMVSGWVLLVMAAFSAPRPYFEFYEQTVTLTFKTSAAAKSVEVDVLPLYDGRRLAIAQR